MRNITLLLLSIIIHISCTSQNKTIHQEAQAKVNELRPLLSLSESQTIKFIRIETNYLKEIKKLPNSVELFEYNIHTKKIKEKRNSSLKTILSHEQLLRLDVIENNRINQIPIRVQ
ncbi:MAG TPA: hypothetical protein PK191_07810 [Niabella sp.]|nr:hypothetical protein [Niabella sp.]HOZ98405.1 hypothetical protein [Niabella sp.]HQW16028.1 hypothetical protein [Niabella sp.]HQX21220.1 hypothetical protein [Niabella sp.]HQX41759.1 hypothetical protein [Niabella sp.]